MNEDFNKTAFDNDIIEIDFFELILALLKKSGLIIFSTLLCGMLCFGISAFLIRPVYSADAMLLVNSGDRGTNYITSDQIVSSTSLVNTYSIIIKSETVKNVVAKNLGMEATYDDSVKLISVEAVNQTQIMKISVQAYDPAVALAVCREIIEVCPDIIVQMTEAGSANVVTEAMTTGLPISPSIPRNTVIGLMLGMLMSCGIVVLGFVMNNKIVKDNDIRMLGMTTLGIIPSYEEGGK